MSQINFRIGDTEKEILEEIAHYEQISLAELSKRMVLRELSKSRKEIALALYQKGKIRKKKALNLSGLTYHEFLIECKERNIVEKIPDSVVNHQIELLKNFDISPYLKEKTIHDEVQN
ncbi:MAG: hypothetical protein ACTSVZ_00670 [Promethearchaeota archaeon]